MLVVINLQHIKLMYFNSRLTSEDNSAIVNLDYSPLFANNTIVFSPSDGFPKLVPVNITNDDIYENEENFRVRLSTSDSTAVTIGSPSVANVFILDDDGKISSGYQINDLLKN